MKQYNKARKKPIHRVVSVVTAAIMATSLMPLSEIWKGAKSLSSYLVAFAAEDQVNVDQTISTAEEFVEWSNIWSTENEEYYTNGAFDNTKYNAAVAVHADDIIELAFSSGSTLDAFSNEDNGTFCSIGTEAYPFTGIILINTSGIGTLNLEKPLFNYLGDSAQILLKKSDSAFLPSTLDSYEITISRTEDATGLPILANYVVPTLGTGETAREWKVKIDGFQSSSYSYGGIIGTIKTNSSPCVSVIYNDGNSRAWKGSGNIGRIVCDMESSSTLKVKTLTDTSGNGIGCNVTTLNGHAGGIVGAMAANSKIVLSDSNTGSGATITAGGSEHYAGGVAGYCDGGIIETTAASYSIAHTLTGTAGAGGLFGYYRTSAGEFDTSKYTGTSTLNSGGNVGGLFGVLCNADTDVNGTLTGGGSITIKGSDTPASRNQLTSNHATVPATNYGGLIGMYRSGALTNTLTIKDITASPSNAGTAASYGGAIGKIDGAGTAYVEFSNYQTLSAASASAVFGGIVGTADEAYMKADDVKVTVSDTFNGGGIIGKTDRGVLELAGKTDLIGAKPADAENCGQIVGIRNSALVFAESTDDSEWKLYRCSGGVNVDDIGTWGEVIRFSNDFKKDHVLTTTGHKATLQGVTISEGTCTLSASGNVTIEEMFARFALNNQIRTSSGVLEVSANATSLCSTNITLAADVNLTNTGLIGITRDDSDNYLDYHGTFDGGSHTVTLAIGQVYGYRDLNDTAASTDEEGSGQIYRHRYLGLIGRTDEATTIQNTTFSGIIDATEKLSTYYIGMAVGRSYDNDLIANNVSVTDADIKLHSGSAKSCIGGLVGEFNTNTTKRTLTISGSSASSLSTFGANINGAAADTGGVIGRINNKVSATDDNGKPTENASDGKFDGTINYVKITNATDQKITGTGNVGGLIGTIENIEKSSKKEDRDLVLTNVTAEGVTVENGSILGDTWYDTEVQLGTSSTNGVTIGSSSNAATVKGTGDMAGLVNHATGQWIVNDVDIVNLAVDSSSLSSFGVLVNKGYKTSATNSALFMYLKSGYNYSISSLTGSKLSSATVFDEIVAYSANGDVTANGQGIVSIATADGTVKMTKNSADNNTYVGQTDLGKKANSNTRYYYNLDDILKGKTLDAPHKLLAWSIQQYADSSLSGYFENPYSNGIIGAASDVFNMTGLSYYPVNVDAGKTFTINGTVQLYNEEVEKTVTVTSPADKKRSTLNPTQHFLMQNGIFHNVVGNLKVGTLTLKGNVAQLESGGSGSGALVCGEIKGTGPDATAKFNKDVTSSTLNLAGIEVWNKGDSSPLLINTIPRYADVTIMGVKTVQVNNADAYPNGKQVASSLIGTVGNTDATDISIVFKDVMLDARLTNSKLKSTTAATALAEATDPGETGTDEEKAAYQKLVKEDAAASKFDSVYHTKNSIFTKASFLKSLSYDPDYKSSITAEYNYAFAKDWQETAANSGAYNHIANVTYGAEISLGTSSQYNGLEYEYSDENYNSPLEAKPEEQYEEFDDAFQRYVSVAYNADDRNYQLKINHHSTDISGCGTYNDPYIISNGNELKTIVKILNKTNPTDVYIGIPDDGVNSSWCSDTKDAENPLHTTHIWYKFGTTEYEAYKWNPTTSQYELDSTKANLTEYQMRNYLAKAYYKINGAITIDSFYEDIGSIGEYESDSSGTKASFHGVIDGGGAHITMNTIKPFITASSGCVVKNLTIDVAQDVFLRQASATAFTLDDSTSCKAYGAVIGKVMGGDNILDNVHVSFSDDQMIQIDGAKAQLVPVGAYIGMVVNGGVYFRNMARKDKDNKLISYGLTNSNVKGFVGTSNSTSTWDTNLVNNTTTKWLYVNPIIGRVINGFAVTESDAYRPFETGSRSRIYVKENAEAADPANTANYSAIVTNETNIKYNERVTMQNGTKNYSITDISPGLEDLEVTSAYAISPKNAQSFFLMSCMVNSGMSYNTGNIGYYNTGMMSRCAEYSHIGINTTTKSDCPDYNNKASNDAQGKEGWLVQQYVGPSYATYAKQMANKGRTTTITLSSKQDYIMPDSFRGIGNFFQNDTNNVYKLKVTTFTGNGSTILLNTYFRYYSTDYSSNTNTLKEAYKPWVATENVGLGLFNYQPHAGAYNDFILSGTLKTDVIAGGTSNSVSYTTSCNANGYLNVGMLFGVTDVTQTIDSVALQDVDVFGIRHTGGLIGDFPGDTNKTITINNTQSYDSINVKVRGANTAGGMIGSSRQGTLNINFNNNTFGISEITSLSTSTTASTTVYTYGVGGLVGVWRGGKGVGNPANISNITIQSSNANSTAKIDGGANFNCGGIIGTQNRAPLNLDNCIINNVSCYANGKQSDGDKKYDNGLCGGIVGYTTSYSMITIENTHLNTDVSPKAEISNTGMNSGGFIGGSGNGDDEAGFVIKNSSIQNYTISGTQKVGGIVGGRSFRSDKNDTNNTYDKNFILENVKISKCTIKGDNYVGSILGYLDWYQLLGYNIQCDNLTFSRYTSSGQITNLGYVVGYVSTVPPSERGNKSGYKAVKLVGFTRQNVSETGSEHLVGNDTFGADGSGNAGYVIFADYNGKSLNPTNNTKSSYTKTTVTVDNDDTATPTNTATNVLYNTFTEDFLYSVTSDNVTTSSQNVSNQKTVTYRIPKINSTTRKVERNNKGEIIYEVKSYSYGDNWPNVTSSPSYYLNSNYSVIHAASGGNPAIEAQHFLTGDGVSSLYYSASAINNIPDSVAKSIITDIGSNENQAYLNTGLDATALSNLNTALSTDQKYSTFKKEMGTRANGITRDFPVLVVDDINGANTTTFINNYLKLLTNSELDYSTNKEGVFTVRTAKCTYDGSGKYTADYTASNLRYSSGSGFSISNRYDNQEKDDQNNPVAVFSLIDVEFYDPSGSGNVAYHLYVPCVVKKLLQFNFEATTLSGSSYKIEREYTDNRKNTLLENFGNPVTIEFRYTYKRNLMDWRDAILAGENVLFSFSKDILVVSATEDPTTHTKDAPGPMKMILVDPNIYSDGTKQNRSFYADNTASGQTCIISNGSNYQLQLSGFTSESGDAYVPKLVNDFLLITATKVNGTGNFTKADGSTLGSTGIPSDATVRVVYIDPDTNEEKTEYLKPSETNTGNFMISSEAEDHSVIYADGRNGETDKLYEDYYVTLLTERPDPQNETYTAVAVSGGDYVVSSEGTTGAFKARLSNEIIWLKAKGEGENGTYNIEKLYHYSFESMRQLISSAPDGSERSYPTQSVQAKESHLYVGDLYNNTLSVKTFYSDEDNPNIPEEVTMALPELNVQLSANVTLTSSARVALGRTVQDNDKIKVYQSLLYSYNWYRLGESTKHGILTANDLEMISYTVTGNQIQNGNVTSKYSKTDSENRSKYLDESNRNYVELKNLINIAKGLSSGVTIDAKFKLKYADSGALLGQFAGLTDEEDQVSGTKVVGYSNISSSDNETANSAMSTSKIGNARYYSTEDNMASLQYDAVGKYDDDFGELGINANDLNEKEQTDGKVKIETVAYYSLDNWSSLETPKKIQLEFELFDKTGKVENGDWKPYSDAKRISDYLDDFKVYTSKDDLDGTDPACTVTQAPYKYTYTIDLNEAGYQLLDYNEGLESYTFYVDYSVFTGKKTGNTTWFENTKTYQNYMVKLTVSLLDKYGETMPGSNPNNHIIYTNARINPDIIDTTP